MKRWKYKWLHLPTGKIGEEVTADDLSRLMFLEKLSSWNQDSRWKYWEYGNFE